MDKYSRCILGHFSNENSIAITVECLNAEYPNVEFSAVETGTGKYELSCVSRHGLFVHNSALLTFKNVAWILYKSIPLILSHK